MIHFFNKKFFLVDYLKDFVDVHNHILPGIDDGAKTVEDSIELIEEFSSIGINKFIATPHIMHNYYPNNPESILSAKGKLVDRLLQEKMTDITLDVAAEHMVDANFEEIVDQNKVMPLRKSYLLIEMSYLQPPINFDQAVHKITSKRYYPILAHPERYAFLLPNSEKFKTFKQQGIQFQMNLLSLSEFYGTDVQKKASLLLNAGLMDYVASDIHNLRQFKALKEVQINNKQLKVLLPVIERTIDVFY